MKPKVIDKMRRMLIEVLFFSIIIPSIMVLGFLTLSYSDQSYIRDISPNVIFWPFVLIFLLIYATPAYLALFLVKKVATFSKMELIADAVTHIFWLTSIPLHAMGYGYYAISQQPGNKIENDKKRMFISNALSIVFILALQVRQIPNAVFAVISISILLSVIVIIVGKARKSD